MAFAHYYPLADLLAKQVRKLRSEFFAASAGSLLLFEGLPGMDAGFAVDVVAERVRALGFPAPATYREFMAATSIEEPKGVPSAEAMIKSLVDGQEAVVRTARSILPVAERANDQPAIDLLTQRMQVHEKTAWMLRSLLA